MTLHRKLAVAAAVCLAPAAVVHAQPTETLVSDAITYQGTITYVGMPINGELDFRFSLWDDESGGSEKGAVYINDKLVTEGKFTVELDFRGDVRFTTFKDEQWWLEVAARWGAETGGDESYTTTYPRIKLTRAPYASISGSIELGKEFSTEKDTTAWKIINIGTGGAGDFRIFNPISGATALYTESNGSGDTFGALSTGSGLTFRARTTGTGGAGLFEIASPGSTADALSLLTSGSGRALFATATSGIAIHAQSDGAAGLRAVSNSGPGLLAESTSGVGLRASSTSGTALDVVGSSAFSGTAQFNAAMPFSVASPTLIPNLNAALLGGQNAAAFHDAANLTGTLSDALLSANVARLGSAQTFTGAKAFSATVTFGATANFNAATPFSVATPTLIPNLNAALLEGETAAAFHNAGNLSTGTLPNARLSADVARRSGSQTFVGSQSVTGDVSITGEQTITGSQTISADQTVSGDLHVGGRLTRDYMPASAALATPLAFGYVNSDATLGAHTPNVALSEMDSPQPGVFRYLVTIDGESYTNGAYVAQVTPVFGGGTGPLMAATSADSGRLVVRLHDRMGVSVQQAFQFVIYKP